MTEKLRFPTTGWGGAETFLAVCWRCCCAGSRPRMHGDEMCGQQVAQGHCKLFCNCEIGPSGKRARKIEGGDGGMGWCQVWSIAGVLGVSWRWFEVII